MNKPFAIAVFLGVFCIISVHAQFALKRHSICAAGDTWVGAMHSVQYVVSSTGYESNYSGNYHLTPGILQPVAKQKKVEGMQVISFPNPVKKQLYIKIISDSPAYYEIDVMDISGKTLEVISSVFVADYYMHEINFSSYEQGLYFLRITGKSGSYQKTLKIEKIQ